MTCGAFIANLLQQRCVSLVSCVLLEKEISAGDLSQVRNFPSVTLALAWTWGIP